MKKILTLSALAASAALLAACGSGSSNAPVARYTVQITNLTNAQPLSPAAVILHDAGFNSFRDGDSASLGLERLAEGGMNADVLSDAQAATQHITSASGSGPIAPKSMGEVMDFQVALDRVNNLRLTVITMLVKTNDGFTGVNAASLSNLAVGQSMTLNGPAWDAGTEANTEAAADLPGPSTEGFNSARSDSINRIRFHQGVVTQADGLATSALTEADRFDNPTSRIVVTRTQ